MFDQSVIVQTVMDTPADHCRRGCAATFVRLQDGWGFKFYNDSYTCLYTYDRQHLAASLGLAPRLGNWFDFRINDFTYYGYTTEIAKVCLDRFLDAENVTASEFLILIDNNPDFLNRYKAFRNEIYDSEDYIYLSKNLRKNGFKTSDMHPGNIGYLDGQLVAIDFDIS